MGELETWFAPFRDNIIGNERAFAGPFGERRIVYLDWTASGRLYGPIERALLESAGPYVANTHSESNLTGTTMTHAYHEAQRIIKQHVHAGPRDVIICAGAGMTAVINKFQRILGLRVAEQIQPYAAIPDEIRPVVFVTHMEHHSNQTSWLETIADVEVVEPDGEGRVCVASLRALLEKHARRPIKIGAFTGCSNVTGIETPYHALARAMHEHGGVCFVDFAASAPYVDIDMHPAGDPLARLDAIFFSPHKFLGGPGSTGVLIFDSGLYRNRVPDQPGGGTVNWTNPWQQHSFVDNIEAREDGGTPGFLQTIKAAMAIRLKERMGSARMRAREHELMSILLAGLKSIPNAVVLAGHIEDRLGILSFYLEDIHFNLVVRLLNDRYGIQVRGGCSCAGTYGHYLLHVDPKRSKSITDRIDAGDLTDKPGWVRLSIHPTTTDAEAHSAVEALRAIAANAHAWSNDYDYDPHANEFRFRGSAREVDVRPWFDIP
jgi:selenocysteine lyase/cysteine desulfurase